VLLVAFLLIANRSTAILIGGLILVVDALLTWWVIRSITGPSKITHSAFYLYLLFHVAVIFPITLLFTMNAGKFNDELKFFDRLQRSDGQPARFLAADVGHFSELDLFDLSPRTDFPDMCAGNMSVFKNVQTLDPYTPLRPLEWDRLVRGEIADGFVESGEAGGILDPVTAANLDFLGVDYIVTSGRVMEIRGYTQVTDIDLTDSFREGAKLFKVDSEEPRVWAVALTESGKLPVGELELRRNGARTEIDTPAYSVIVEISYDKNWQVTVDGNPIDISPWQGVFCEINTGPGRHVIDFQYRPESVRKGAIVSSAGIIIVLGWILLSVPRKRDASPLP
jgi:hypothetical protein